MCGIAGYSLTPRSSVERTLAAQTLLASIAERGSDAVGYAYRGAATGVAVHKQRGGAGALLEQVRVPEEATQLLVHVRDYTKGHPTIEANNHPVRYGAVVGIHNGIILNDEEIMASHSFARQEPDMTVDSEAIFAVAEEAHSSARALEDLRGSLAAAWLDERRPGVLFLARGVGRPLWTGQGSEGTFFASTRKALELAERYLRLRLRKEELPEGTLLALAEGRTLLEERFRPDHDYVDPIVLPAVRAPQEGAACLKRLAAIYAAL